MATFLYSVGRWCFRRRGVVVSVWVALLVLAGVGAVTLSGQTSNSFSLPDSESSRASAIVEKRTGIATDVATARLVVQAPQGRQISADQKVIAEALAAATTDHVAQVADPFTSGAVSRDGRTAYATITYDRQPGELVEADREALAAATSQLEDAGLTAVAGGTAFQTTEAGHTAEVIGLLIALVVLVMTFGSLVAAGMPMLSAIIGVGLGALGIVIMTGFMDLSSTTPALATMLGLAVGIDYALFIMSRFKHEVMAGRSPQEAAGVAVGTAGSAVVFAGLTVVIALSALAIVGVSFLAQMGLAAAATVLVAVLVALTFLPAMLGFAGRRVIRGGSIPGLRQRDPEAAGTRTSGRRWVEFITRVRVPVLVAGLVIAAVGSIPVASMQLALPDDGSKPADSGERRAFDLISENFGPGANGPLIVVVDVADADQPTAAVDAALQRISSVDDDVAAVVPPVLDPQDAQQRARFEGQLQKVEFATIAVIPESGPAAQATKDLVSDLRAALADLPAATGATAYLTGTTAADVDISETLAEAFPTYLVVVVGLAVVLLVLVFRSVLVPLKAAVGFLASLGVSLGATVAVFQWGWLNELLGLDTTAPVVFILPLLLTGILFGLAMDYEVFLVSRMREEHVHGRPATEAVIEGFASSARVVTAAALIMIGVFSGFAGSADPIIKSIGFALATGVFIDAFLVRMTLVPALMSLVGERMWWLPRWLDRLLPNLDIEGESLTRRLTASEGAGSSQD